MQNTETVIQRALVSGTIAGVASAAVAALTGKQETGSYAAPLNATSHIVWGEPAARKNSPSLKYTLTGFLLNHGAAIFWAGAYEALFGARSARTGRRGSPLRPLLGGAVVTAGAYITDYYLAPSRFTPGFEKRVSGRSLATIYAALALGIAAHDLIRNK